MTCVDSIINSIGDSISAGAGDSGSDSILEWLFGGSIVPTRADNYNATFTRSTVKWYTPTGTSTLQEITTNAAAFEDDGFLFEPERTNKVECYSAVGADQEMTELVTGTDSDMSGANNWLFFTGGTFDIDSTTAGKLYMKGDGADDYAYLSNTFEKGKRYEVSLKAKNTAAGGGSEASTTIRVAAKISGTLNENYFEITPTGTEQTFTATVTAASTTLSIGLETGFSGVAFEIDDVSVKEIGGLSLEPLITGTDSDMSGANNWTSVNMGALDIDTTVPGKLYMLGDSTGTPQAAALAAVMSIGKTYKATFKARLNAGASTTFRAGRGVSTTDGAYFEFTPTSTETEFTGVFLCENTGFSIGLPGQFDGVALEIDDVSVREVVSGLSIGTQAYHDGSTFQNPIPSMTLSGDVAATLSIVDDSTEIAAAGLDVINASGKVYKLDNSDVAVAAYSEVLVTCASNATETFTLSTWYRNTDSTSLLKFHDNANETSSLTASATYIRTSSTGAATTDSDLRIRAADGDIVYFILPQLEEGNAVTSPIVVQGNSGGVTRTVDALSLPVADGTNFQQSEGSLLADVVFGWSGLADNQGIITVRDNYSSLLYATHATNRIVTNDGTTAAVRIVGWTADTQVKVFVRWNDSEDELACGANGSSSTVQAFDANGFTLGTHYRIGYAAVERFWLSNVRVFKVDKGTTYLEGETS